ncbi:hypothetical protein, partial [Nonomuraea sp. NPDC048916]|uniref:hypothetical protein n=1 Tax=Nonomuraea sp. NPDC048916 TaxID=3154232 RepID=UPI0033D45550
ISDPRGHRREFGIPGHDEIVGEAQGHLQTITDTPAVTLANDLKIYRCSTGKPADPREEFP